MAPPDRVLTLDRRTRSHRRAAVLVLGTLVLAACASFSGGRPRWFTLDGKPADPAALRKASLRCRERVEVGSRTGPLENDEWSLAVLTCLHSEGFVLLSAAPELAR
jgi:hypothetical protein